MKTFILSIFSILIVASSAQATPGVEALKREIDRRYPEFRPYIDRDRYEEYRVLVSRECGLFYNEYHDRRACNGYAFCIARPDGQYLRGEISESLAQSLDMFRRGCMRDDYDRYPSEFARRYIQERHPELAFYIVEPNRRGVVLISRACGLFANDFHDRMYCDGYDYCIGRPDGSYIGSHTGSNDIEQVARLFGSRCR